MIHRDPKCVFVADSLGLAEVVVLYLGKHDIVAQAMNPATLGGLLGLTPISPTGISSTGIEVWVNDIEQAPRARELLAEQEKLQAAKASRAARSGNVEATCDECETVTVFPASEGGSVQDCPHCGAYMDIPETEADPTGEPAA